MSLDDLVTSQPEPVPTPDSESAMIQEGGADAAPVNASEEGFVDDQLGNLGELDVKDRTRKRIEELAADNKRLATEREEYLQNLSNAEGRLEALESQGKKTTLEDLPVSDLAAIKANPDQYDVSAETLARIDEIIVEKKVEEKLNDRFSKQDAETLAAQQQDRLFHFAENVLGKEIHDNKSTAFQNASDKLSQVQSTFTDVGALQQAVAVLLAARESGQPAQEDQRELQKLRMQNRIEGNTRAAQGALTGVKEALAGAEGRLAPSRQGQKDSNFRSVVNQLDVIKSLI